VVKKFFNEKEVTSTLVMDALFSGCKQIEQATRLDDKVGLRSGKARARMLTVLCLGGMPVLVDMSTAAAKEGSWSHPQLPCAASQCLDGA
jgi:hypothetical protein